jgi:integrase
MIYLGINAGFGNTDVSTLPTKVLDLEGGWVTFARPKNGIPRRAPLWPETAAALREVVVKGERLAFSMKCKRRGNAVTRAFGRLLRRLKINGRRRLGFYSLRHSFRTVADNTKDFPAIRLVMGHSSDGQIDGTYVERIDDARLQAVTDHVRAWLFGSPQGAGQPTTDEKTRQSPAAATTEPATEDRPALRLYIA